LFKCDHFVGISSGIVTLLDRGNMSLCAFVGNRPTDAIRVFPGRGGVLSDCVFVNNTETLAKLRTNNGACPPVLLRRIHDMTQRRLRTGDFMGCGSPGVRYSATDCEGCGDEWLPHYTWSFAVSQAITNTQAVPTGGHQCRLR
jgi:hypothetical protein